VPKVAANEAPINSGDQQKAVSTTDARLREFADHADVDRFAGQLLVVGLPGDVSNSSDKNSRIVIQELGVGGVFLSNYLYAPKDARRKEVSINAQLSRASIWHSMLNEWAVSEKSVARLPLFLAADFESSGLNSFAGIIPAPPVDALTLAATQSDSLIQRNGALVGAQLKILGVNMLFGPVLDIDQSFRKVSPYPLESRSFGSTSPSVSHAAAAYLSGLNAAGVLAVVKHYPGLGTLPNVNLHDPEHTFPPLQGSPADFVDGLDPFRTLSGSIAGLMTSHVQSSALSTSPPEIVPFSSLLVDKLIRSPESVSMADGTRIAGLGLSDQLVVTDDLSDMGPVLFAVRNGSSFTSVARKALQAGHDLLLFVHVNAAGNKIEQLESTEPPDPTRKQNWISVENLREIRAGIADAIKRDPKLETQFRNSLFRILKRKYSLFAEQGLTVEEFLGGKALRPAQLASAKDLTSVRVDGVVHESAKLFAETFELATLVLSSKPWEPLNLGSADGTSTRVSILVSKEAGQTFRQGLADQLAKKWKLKTWQPVLGDEFEAAKASLEADLREFDKVIVTVSSRDQANVLMHVMINVADQAAEKLTVILKTAPSLFLKVPEQDRSRVSQLFQRVVVVGNFTTHPASHLADLRLLSGGAVPRPRSQLPVCSVDFCGGAAVQPSVVDSGPRSLNVRPNTISEQLKIEMEKVEQLTGELQEAKEGKAKSDERFLNLRSVNSILPAAALILEIGAVLVFIPRAVRRAKRARGARWHRVWSFVGGIPWVVWLGLAAVSVLLVATAMPFDRTELRALLFVLAIVALILGMLVLLLDVRALGPRAAIAGFNLIAHGNAAGTFGLGRVLIRRLTFLFMCSLFAMFSYAASELVSGATIAQVACAWGVPLHDCPQLKEVATVASNN
jgi:beta-glucosidase-like glycosyl hydrolase